MLLLKVLTTFCVAALAQAQHAHAPAPPTNDSPEGVYYIAVFDTPTIKGGVGFFAIEGIVFGLTTLEGFPRTGGPFLYRIHQRRVPPSGDCRRTLGIFDPYDGNPHAATAAGFDVGDLSGKHGAITGRSRDDIFIDQYLSLNPPNGAFIGDKSVVIRSADGARIACASFVKETEDKVPKNMMQQAEKLLGEYKSEKKDGDKKHDVHGTPE